MWMCTPAYSVCMYLLARCTPVYCICPCWLAVRLCTVYVPVGPLYACVLYMSLLARCTPVYCICPCWPVVRLSTIYVPVGPLYACVLYMSLFARCTPVYCIPVGSLEACVLYLPSRLWCIVCLILCPLWSDIVSAVCRTRSGVRGLPEGAGQYAVSTAVVGAVLLYAALSGFGQPGTRLIFWTNVNLHAITNIGMGWWNTEKNKKVPSGDVFEQNFFLIRPIYQWPWTDNGKTGRHCNMLVCYMVLCYGDIFAIFAIWWYGAVSWEDRWSLTSARVVLSANFVMVRGRSWMASLVISR